MDGTSQAAVLEEVAQALLDVSGDGDKVLEAMAHERGYQVPPGRAARSAEQLGITRFSAEAATFVADHAMSVHLFSTVATGQAQGSAGERLARRLIKDLPRGNELRQQLIVHLAAQH